MNYLEANAPATASTDPDSALTAVLHAAQNNQARVVLDIIGVPTRADGYVAAVESGWVTIKAAISVAPIYALMRVRITAITVISIVDRDDRDDRDERRTR